MNRRLLLDSDVVAYLELLPLPVRARIWQRLRAIAHAPDRWEDYHQRGVGGRDLSAHIFLGHAILFWDDLADRHVKIPEIVPADEAAN